MSVDHPVELPVTFTDDDGTVIVNFGILTGREATQAELDRLALALREGGAGPEMTITAARRQDYAPRFESVAHQVQVTFIGPDTPPTAFVETICGAWATSCAEDRSVEPLEP